MEKKVHPGYTEANRLAWNEAMPRHQVVRKEHWDQQFSTPGYVVQKDPELSLLSSLPVAGKDIIQLCCNNGVELLSLKNMGASRCLGVDISDLAIAEAKARAELCHIDAEFLCADVFQLPSSLEMQFDLVYITVGALTWLHDLEALFQKSYALLRPQGMLLIYEQHPLTYILAEDDDKLHKATEIVSSYFVDEPYIGREGIDYIGGTIYPSLPNYQFTHPLSKIINSIIQAGFQIREFNEYPHDISLCCQGIPPELKLPLSYSLLAKK